MKFQWRKVYYVNIYHAPDDADVTNKHILCFSKLFIFYVWSVQISNHNKIRNWLLTYS